MNHFENNYMYSRDIVVEYQYKIGARRMLFWCAACLLFALAYGIIGLVTDRVTWYVVVAFVALAVYYAVYPYLFTKKSEKMLRERNGGEIPVTQIRFGEEIDVTEGDTVDFTVEYRDLNKITVLKKGIFLVTKGRRGIMLDPEAFTGGTVDEFLAFLKEKCPHATWEHK